MNPAFSWLCHTSDLKTCTLVATLPGAWHDRVSARTGWLGVSVLSEGELVSLILQCGSLYNCLSRYPFLRCTSMLLGCLKKKNYKYNDSFFFCSSYTTNRFSNLLPITWNWGDICWKTLVCFKALPACDSCWSAGSSLLQGSKFSHFHLWHFLKHIVWDFLWNIQLYLLLHGLMVSVNI